MQKARAAPIVLLGILSQQGQSLLCVARGCRYLYFLCFYPYSYFVCKDTQFISSRNRIRKLWAQFVLPVLFAFGGGQQ